MTAQVDEQRTQNAIDALRAKHGVSENISNCNITILRNYVRALEEIVCTRKKAGRPPTRHNRTPQKEQP